MTPLVPLADVARDLGVASFVVKDESLRLGVPSFKLLGSSWAVRELIRRRIGRPADADVTLIEMREHVRSARAVLCTASDGNYGRSVAALAEMLGCASVIFLPSDTAAQRITDVRAHGARVEVVDGGYDATVSRARAEAKSHAYWYCPDTALFDADEAELEFVRAVAAGYSTLVVELVEQLGRAPDVLFVQAGVGGLAAGVIAAVDALGAKTRIVTVEPRGSNAVQISIEAGEPRAVADEFTMMAGLRAQSVSAAAWPLLRSRVNAALTIADDDAAGAMRLLASLRVIAGEAGGAGVAGALVALQVPDVRARLGVDAGSVVATINTEGATDAENYARVMRAGSRPRS